MLGSDKARCCNLFVCLVFIGLTLDAARAIVLGAVNWTRRSGMGLPKSKMIISARIRPLSCIQVIFIPMLLLSPVGCEKVDTALCSSTAPITGSITFEPQPPLRVSLLSFLSFFFPCGCTCFIYRIPAFLGNGGGCRFPSFLNSCRPQCCSRE